MLDYPTPVPSSSLDYESLLARCLGQVPLAARVLGRFEEQFLADFERMETALAAQDDQQLRTLAHRLKGACANVAAARLRDWTHRIEQAAEEKQLGEIAACVQGLREEWSRFAEVKTRYVGNVEPSASGSGKGASRARPGS